MILALINDDGVVIGRIENIEEYDLTKHLARAGLVEEISDLIKQAKSQED